MANVDELCMGPTMQEVLGPTVQEVLGPTVQEVLGPTVQEVLGPMWRRAGCLCGGELARLTG